MEFIEWPSVKIKPEHLHRAVQAWRTEKTRHIKLNPDLIESFAEILAEEDAGRGRLFDENRKLAKELKDLKERHEELKMAIDRPIAVVHKLPGVRDGGWQ